MAEFSVNVVTTAGLCLAILLTLFGAPILADTIASAVCKIKTPFSKQE